MIDKASIPITAATEPSLSTAGGLSPGGSTALLSSAATGIAWCKIAELPHYHKRAFAHNYHAPFIYHIIFTKKEGFEYFGVVKGDARIPYGHPGCAYIEESQIGRIIAWEIIRIKKIFPILKVFNIV